MKKLVFKGAKTKEISFPLGLCNSNESVAEDNKEVAAMEFNYALPVNIQIIISSTFLSLSDILGLPTEYAVHQNYPNPFNPVTTLRYDLPEDAIVNIIIYDMMGRVVKTLVNGEQTVGYKSLQWNAIDDAGKPVSAGVFLYRIHAGEFKQTKKMVLLK